MTWKGRGQCVLREELPAAFSYGLFLTLRGNPEAPGLSSFNLWASLPLELCFAQEVYYPRKRCYETSGLWEVAIPGDQGQCCAGEGCGRVLAILLCKAGKAARSWVPHQYWLTLTSQQPLSLASSQMQEGTR